jgi:hypothetical protein
MAVNVNIVVTPVINPSDSQLVATEWSSRYDLPLMKKREIHTAVKRELKLHGNSDTDR